MVKLGFFVLLLVSFGSCKDITDQYLYKRPSWLEGKLYTQMDSREELSLFVEGVSRTAYKDVLDRSGYFTVFAPTNNAMKAYMTEKGYASVQDIPVEVMEGIVRFHTLQNGWNIEQLKYFRGRWIDEDQVENYTNLYYKRSTIFEDSARFITYGNAQFTKGVRKKYKIIPSGRKVIPLYYREALELEDKTMDDYAQYIKRSDIGADDICYGYGKVIDREIPAENGFVYTVDRVMEPMKTVRQYLENSDNQEKYSKFLSILDEFRYLTPDYDATNAQEGADLGRDIDTLYTSSYRMSSGLLFFNPDQEISLLSSFLGGTSLGKHPSIFVPNDAAFNELMDATILADGNYFNLKGVPLFVKAYLLQSFMSQSAAFDVDLDKGIVSLDNDSINNEVLPVENVAENVICSNGYFVGLNKSYVPDILGSVTGPVVMRPDYTYWMYSMYRTGMLSSLKTRGNEYSVFAVPDVACERDSSFILSVPDPDEPLMFNFWSWNFLSGMEEFLSRSTQKSMLKNHVALGTFKSYDEGGASVQYLPSLGGNYILYYERNDTTFARGPVGSSARRDFVYTDPETGEDSTWRDSEAAEIVIEKLTDKTTNGDCYSATNWFSLNGTKLYGRLQGYSKFMELLYKAGLANQTYSSLQIGLLSGEQCTGFIPNDAALETFQADTIENLGVLRMLLKSHFVRGAMIFTDGNEDGGDYRTLSGATMAIETGPDHLVLLNDKTDLFDDYNVIEDNPEFNLDIYADSDNPLRDNLLNTKLRLNIFSANDLSQDASIYDYTTQAVTHQISTVIVPEELKAYFGK